MAQEYSFADAIPAFTIGSAASKAGVYSYVPIAEVSGTLAGIAIAVAGAFVMYSLLRATLGLRLDEEQEFEGADISIHKISATPERDAGF